jgi:hypothetical protein
VITREIDCFHLGLLERVLRWTLIAAAFSTVATLAVSPGAAFGLAAGAATSVFFVCLHRRVFLSLLGRRSGGGRPIYSLVWLAKWPILGVPLYYALKSGLIAGGWFCVGLTMVPAVAVVLALRAVGIDLWQSAVAQRSRPLP